MSDDMFEVKEYVDRTIPEDTFVPAILTDMKVETVPYTDKGTGEQKTFKKVRWFFTVNAGEYEGRKPRGETNAEVTNHPDNKLRSWAEALLGRELPLGTHFTPDDLVGRECEISVLHEKDKKDPEKVYERVDVVLPTAVRQLTDEPPF